MNCVFLNKFKIDALIERSTWVDWDIEPYKQIFVDLAFKLHECNDEIQVDLISDAINKLAVNVDGTDRIFEASDLMAEIGKMIVDNFSQVSIFQINWFNHYKEEVIEIFDQKHHKIKYQNGKIRTFNL